MPPEELESELQQRNCSKIGQTQSGYAIWETEDGDPFSVPPPEEDADGKLSYPDWMLDDLIRETGIPAAKKPRH
jgi:hypothetical protein